MELNKIKLIVVFLLLTTAVKADILINEKFISGALPTGWTNNIIQGAQGWSFRNAPALTSPSGGYYTVFDDALLGAATIPNEAALTTGATDCSNRTNVKLKFSHYWQGVEFTHAYVEISNDGGTAWNTLVDYEKITQGSLASPLDVVFDVTAFAANQADVRVRFRYTDGSQAGDFWYIDDILLYADPDVGVTALIEPDYLGCNDTLRAIDTVKIAITNFGVNAVSNIPLTCVISGGISVTLTGTYTGALLAGQTDTFTFTTAVNLSTDDIYHFLSYTSLGTDEYLNNDTLLTGRRQRVQAYPYLEQFDYSDAGWYEYGSTNNRKWVHDDVPYLGGPQGNGKSWYTDVSGDLWNYFYLESPTFDFTTVTNPSVTLNAKFNLAGHPSWQYVRLEYSINDGGTWSVLGAATDPGWYNTPSYYWYGNQASWTKYQHTLCNLIGQSCVKFRFRGYMGQGGANAYFAFDNFKIIDSVDVGVISFVEPVNIGCLFSDQQEVIVQVYNWSCNTVYNIPAKCDISGVLTQTISGIIDSIQGNSVINYTFPTTFDMTTLGIYNFSSYTEMLTDGDNSNDTSITTINVNQLKVVSFPYTEDFNADDGVWVESAETANRQWEYSSVPYLAGSPANDSAWYLNFTGDLWNNVYVETPVFDLTEITKPILTFDAMWNLSGHPSWQYVRVEYSLNGGTSWSLLGNATEPNWYNQPSYYWYGNQPIWQQQTHDLCYLSGESCVKLRFNAYCGQGGGNAYFAFDNVEIDDGTGDDLKPLLIFEPDGGDCAFFGAAENLGVLIVNNTCRALTNVPVQFDLTGPNSSTIIDTIPGPIPRFGRYYHPFTNTIDLSTSGTYNLQMEIFSNTGGAGLSYINDTSVANNTIIENRYHNAINTFTYKADFNGDNDGWASRPLSLVNNFFKRDTVPYLGGAAGNGESWYLDMTGNTWTYSYVESPIYDLTGLTNPMLYFDEKHNLAGHPSWQYVRVEYSINGGASWTILGNSTDPNWYNQASYYWYGNQPNWNKVQHSLCNLVGQTCVKFRFRAYCGQSGSNAYFAFDNFEIKDSVDVGVISYIDPVDVGCLFGQLQEVTVEVYNWSCVAVSNIPITCDITGQVVTTLAGTVPGPVPAGGSVNYTFPITFDMTATGTYNFNSYTSLSGDGNIDNDTLSTTINVNQLKVTSYPYAEDFNIDVGYWVESGETTNRQWEYGSVPYLAGSPASDSAWYLNFNGDLWNNVYVESPVLDLSSTTNPTLSFDAMFNLAGHPSWQYVRVEYSINGGGTWTVLGSSTQPNWYNQPSYYWYGNQPTWQNYEHDLCILSGESCAKIRFRAYCGQGGANARFAFDNVVISGGKGDDIEPLLVFPPDGADCAGFTNAEAVGVLIQNNGCRSITNIPVDLDMTGAGTQSFSEVIPGPISRFSRYYYSFANTLDMSIAGTYNIEVTTNSNLAGIGNDFIDDTVTANNSITETRHFNPITTYPYFQDFDTDNDGWASRNLNLVNHYFNRDTLPYLNGPEGNGKSWYLDMTGNTWTYSYIETPVFDFTSVTSPMMSFDVKHNLAGHPSWQYVRVEYSTNGGGNWTILGSATDPQWYNQPSYYFYGNQLSWRNVQHTLCSLIGQSCVKFRFRSYCGQSGANAQFAFDNFRLFDAQDVGVTSILAPIQDECLYSDSSQVTVRLYNWSCSSVSGIPIQCDVTGANTVVLLDTVLGAVAASGFVDVTFPQYFDMTALGNYNFTAYSSMPVEVNRENDTSRISRTVAHTLVNVFDSYEDFNTTSGFGEWFQTGNATNRNWTWGTVPYLGGPQGKNNSWYLDFSGDLWNNVYLESPVYDFTNLTNPIITFEEKHNLAGHPSWQYVRVEYSTNGGGAWTVLGSAAEPQWYNQSSYYWYGNRPDWTLVRHDLCALAGQSCIKFRMRAYCGQGGANAQFALDNWHITDTPLDAEMVSVTGCWGSEYELEATVRNVSLPCTATSIITDLTLTYSIDGSAPVSVNYTGLSISGGATDLLIIPTTTTPTSTSEVKVWVSFPNGLVDEIFENDTVYGNVSIWPNCNDHCSNAIEVGLGTTTASQTSNGTVVPLEEPDFLACGGITLENTVWYKFTTNSSGDTVTVIFKNQECTPSVNGLQVSIDSVGTACDTSTYENVFCSSTNDTAVFQWGPLPLPANTTYYIAVDGFAGNDCNFDITLLGAGISTVPIGLMRFDVEVVDWNDANVTWQVSDSENAQRYEIERSPNGSNFSKIGTVKGGKLIYNYLDESLPIGKYYYRLRAVENNGKTTYSSIKKVEIGSKYGLFKVFPNPTLDDVILEISLTEKDVEEVKVEITDLFGREIQSERYNVNNRFLKQGLGISEYPSGTYIIKISINDIKVYYDKIVKL